MHNGELNNNGCKLWTHTNRNLSTIHTTRKRSLATFSKIKKIIKDFNKKKKHRFPNLTLLCGCRFQAAVGHVCYFNFSFPKMMKLSYRLCVNRRKRELYIGCRCSPCSYITLERDLLYNQHVIISDLYRSRNSLCDWIHTRPALDWLACGFSIAYIFTHVDHAFALTQHHRSCRINGLKSWWGGGGTVGACDGASKCSKCLNKIYTDGTATDGGSETGILDERLLAPKDRERIRERAFAKQF